MRNFSEIFASARTAVAVPVELAAPAIEVILKEFTADRTAAIALNVPGLHAAFEPVICAPTRAQLRGKRRDEGWRVSVSAVEAPDAHARFDGDLTLETVDGAASWLTLSGTYAVPADFDAALASSAFSDDLTRCSQKFVREMAIRVAALVNWANVR